MGWNKSVVVVLLLSSDENSLKLKLKMNIFVVLQRGEGHVVQSEPNTIIYPSFAYNNMNTFKLDAEYKII